MESLGAALDGDDCAQHQRPMLRETATLIGARTTVFER